MVWDACETLAESVEPAADAPLEHPLRRLRAVADVVLAVRMEAIREVLLSGFQLELYAPYERPFAYWHICVVGEILEQCYTDLLSGLPADSMPFKSWTWKQKFNRALKDLARSCLLMTLPFLPPAPASKLDPEIREACDPPQPSALKALLRPNFYKRHKWAFRPDYGQAGAEPLGHPDLDEFVEVCARVQSRDELNVSSFAEKAHEVFAGMVANEEVDPWIARSGSPEWKADTVKFLAGLRDTAGNLAEGMPARVRDTKTFDLKRLRWDVAVQPWFPRIVGERQ